MSLLAAVALASAVIVFGPMAASDNAAANQRTVVQTATGAASWYGQKFHGRRTASGERFDMNGLTAAHRSLPFGTQVRVTNPRNGRSVVVRITDRGPHARRLVIDLSRGAAEKIGIINAGIASVTLEVLGR